MTMLAVFKSRAQTLDAVARLHAAGVPAQTVSTPKEAGVGCGVSVKFEDAFFGRVAPLVRAGRYSSFAGYMKRTAGGFVYA